MSDKVEHSAEEKQIDLLEDWIVQEKIFNLIHSLNFQKKIFIFFGLIYGRFAKSGAVLFDKTIW